MNLTNKNRNTIFEIIGYIEGRVFALSDFDGGLLLESVFDLKDRLHDIFDADDVPRQPSVAEDHQVRRPVDQQVTPPDRQVAPIKVVIPPANQTTKRGGRPWTEEQGMAAAERTLEYNQKKTPLIADSDLEAIKARWGNNESFDAIGKSYGCSGSHVRNFLSKHGIDPRRNQHGTKSGGRPALTEQEIQLIIDQKAKGTPSKDIGAMIDRSQHAVDQKYSDLKHAGRVPHPHISAEALQEKKIRQNALVSSKMKEFHAAKKTGNGYIGQRQAQKEAVWYPDDWSDIQAMLKDGTPAKTIAGDYGVTLEQLESFIEQNSGKEKEPDPGESTVLEEAPSFSTNQPKATESTT